MKQFPPADQRKQKFWFFFLPVTFIVLFSEGKSCKFMSCSVHCSKTHTWSVNSLLTRSTAALFILSLLTSLCQKPIKNSLSSIEKEIVPHKSLIKWVHDTIQCMYWSRSQIVFPPFVNRFTYLESSVRGRVESATHWWSVRLFAFNTCSRCFPLVKEHDVSWPWLRKAKPVSNPKAAVSQNPKMMFIFCAFDLPTDPDDD